MSALQEYLDRRRAEQEALEASREADQASPEALLESLNANTGQTADLIGRQTDAAKAQTKSVVDSIELVAKAMQDSRPEAKDVDLSVKRSADDEQRAANLTNKTLKDISESLRELVETNKQIVKHVAPEKSTLAPDAVMPAAGAKASVRDVMPVVIRDKGVNALDPNRRHIEGVPLGGDKEGDGKGKKDDKKLPAAAGGGLGALIGELIHDFFKKKEVPETKPGEVKPGETPKTVGKPSLWERGKRALGDVMVKTADKIDAGKDFVRGKSAEYLERAKAAGVPEKLAQAGSKVKGWAGRAAEVAGEKFGNVAEAVHDKASQYAPKTVAAIEEAAEAAKPKIGNALVKTADTIDSIKAKAATAWEASKPTVGKAMVKTADAIDAAKAKVGGWTKSIGNKLIGREGLIPETSTGAVEGAAEGAATGAKAMGAAESATARSPALFERLADTKLGRAAGWVGKAANKAAIPVAAALSGYKAYETEKDDSLSRTEKNTQHGKTAGGFAGMLAGASAGGMAGTAIGATAGTIALPLIGTVGGGAIGGTIGAIGGGIMGAMGGEWLGGKGVDAVQGTEEGKTPEQIANIKKARQAAAAKAKHLADNNVVIGGDPNRFVTTPTIVKPDDKKLISNEDISKANNIAGAFKAKATEDAQAPIRAAELARAEAKKKVVMEAMATGVAGAGSAAAAKFDAENPEGTPATTVSVAKTPVETTAPKIVEATEPPKQVAEKVTPVAAVPVIGAATISAKEVEASRNIVEPVKPVSKEAKVEATQMRVGVADHEQTAALAKEQVAASAPVQAITPKQVVGTLPEAAATIPLGNAAVASAAIGVKDKRAGDNLATALAANTAILNASKSDEDRQAKMMRENTEALTAATVPLKKMTEPDWIESIKEGFGKMVAGGGAALGRMMKASGSGVESVTKEGGMLDRGSKALGSGVADLTKGTRFESAGKSAGDWLSGATTRAGKATGSALSKAGESVALKTGEVGYNLQKGSASELDLAKGFQGSSSLKGLSDAQTKAFAGNVMKTESGGKLGISNSYGYAGQYQFGADALADNGIMDKDKLAAAKAAAKASGQKWFDPTTGGAHKAFMEDNSNWKNEGGRQAFMSDKKLQDDTFVKYTNKNIEAGYKSGALTDKSTAEDIAGYAKASHLGGAGAANNLFLSGKDKKDAYGTSAGAYAKQGAGAMGTLAQQVEASMGGKTKPIGEATVLAKADDTTKALPATQVAAAPQQTELKVPCSKVAQYRSALANASSDEERNKIIAQANAEPIRGSRTAAQGGSDVASTVGEDDTDSNALVGTQVSTATGGPAGMPSLVAQGASNMTGRMSRAAQAVAPKMSTASTQGVLDTLGTPKMPAGSEIAAMPMSQVSAFANAPVDLSAKQAPMPQVASNAPAEAPPVTIQNTSDMGGSPASKGQSRPSPSGYGNAFDTAVPKLDNIPLHITDLGLVVLNIGHI